MNPVAMIIAIAWGHSRMAMTHGFSDLENQPGLAPRPARKSKAMFKSAGPNLFTNYIF
jgi:hypothetical protein